MNKSPGIKIWNIRKELFILYYAFINRQTPLYSKVPALIGILYLLSPVDFIPDFIPFMGYLDDLLIVPLLLNMSIKLLPGNILELCKEKATRSRRNMGIFFILLIFAVAALMAVLYFILKKG